MYDGEMHKNNTGNSSADFTAGFDCNLDTDPAFKRNADPDKQNFIQIIKNLN
jgi:hypothetical protein